MKIAYKSMQFEGEDFEAIRNDLCLPEGPGYYVFSGFIDEEQVDQILKFYSNIDKLQDQFKGYLSPRHFYKNCPNYLKVNTESDFILLHFFWNDPPNKVLHSVAFQMQTLRNIIESRAPYNEFYPLSRTDIGDKRSAYKFNCSYRYNETKSGSPVPTHKDWMENFDPKRLQGTLYLTQKDMDYKGQGFIFTKNNGEEIVLADEYPIAPGDLVFWRFNNLHGVKNIQTDANQKGFIRITLPLERVYDRPPFLLSPANLSGYITRELRKNKNFVNALRKARNFMFGTETPQ